MSARRRLDAGSSALRLGMALAFGVLVPMLAGAPRAAAAELVAFGTPAATSTFGKGVTFSQAVTIDVPVARAEILITFPGAVGPLVTTVPGPSNGARVLTYTFSTTRGEIQPNTPLEARWRLTMGDGTLLLGPSIRIVYADDRFQWQTIEGTVVRVHWTVGGASFGRRALAIADDAISSVSGLLGVHETDPIDFFVYADQTAFYDALGPGTRENVGGQANTEIRTLFAQISPSAIDDAWVGIVIPHELTHLVFDTAVANPYHFPPRWLNEGIAVYLSERYGSSDKSAVQDAVRSGSLMPLDALGAQFPTTRERFYLAYAESVAAVDYLVRTYGQDALVALVRRYHDGVTDDEAFTDALGVDVSHFDEAWRASLGAEPATPYGPQPAPPGPVPADWQGAPSQPGVASAAPGAGTSSPTASNTPTASPGSPGGGADGDATAGLTLAVLVATMAVVLLALLSRSRRRSRSDEP